MTGTVCGAWWSGPICADGTPNGYSIYEVNDQEVRWRYQPTGLPRDHQMRVYPPGTDRTAPEELVANVWNWDPSWKVVWLEDGQRRGLMSRRVGRDPLSLKLHAGPDLPERRKWVDPYLTSHLFYVPVSTTARQITVEVTDRFGKIYTGRPEPMGEG